MERKRILLICGSLNQTTMMHAIGKHLAARYDCLYTPYYTDGPLRHLAPLGLLDMTIMGGEMRALTDRYLAHEQLPLDEGGRNGPYDLVLTCSDLIIQKNIRDSAIVLVQEGMTDPEDLSYHLVRKLRLPRWLASTSTTRLSLAYEKFCVASEKYREFFARKGRSSHRGPCPLERLHAGQGQQADGDGRPSVQRPPDDLLPRFPHHGLGPRGALLFGLRLPPVPQRPTIEGTLRLGNRKLEDENVIILVEDAVPVLPAGTAKSSAGQR